MTQSACRFYGKNGMFGVLMETHGNQCALIITSHTPCRMEMAGETPAEETCPLIRQEAERLGIVSDAAQGLESWLTGSRG